MSEHAYKICSSAGRMDVDLCTSIQQQVESNLPGVSAEKAQEVAEHLTSQTIGVRALKTLYDVTVDDLAEVLPRCDARKLHRFWQTKYNPANVQRELIVANVSIYAVDWSKVDAAIMEKLKVGKALDKKQRCAMIRAIVSDVMYSMPNVRRCFFDSVAQSMVKDFPRALQDRGQKAKPLECTFLAKKLKCRFDEAVRPNSKKKAVEAPCIPEAYGCVKWRVANFPANETMETLIQKKTRMIQIFNETRKSEWAWGQIEHLMELTYKLQREDINSQMPPKRKRANSATQQLNIPPGKKTEDICKEWPFLFQARGMLVHFKILTGVDFLQCLKDFEQRIDRLDFLQFLGKNSKCSSPVAKLFKRASTRETCDDPETIAIFLMLLITFKEDKSTLLQEIEATTSVDEIKEVVHLPTTPCIISFGPVFQAQKFIVAIDSEPMTTMRNFWGALAVTFIGFYVFNIKYPAEVGNTLEFYQRVVASIDGKGSKVNRKTSRTKLAERLQTLTNDYQAYEDETDDENEEDVDDVQGPIRGAL